MKLVKWLYEQSIWHPNRLDPNPGAFEFRNIKRLWLPLFDLLSILVGVLGIAYGSKIMNELYDAWFIDFAGGTFIAASVAALIGVAFPRLWFVEGAGKLVMLALLGGYSTAIWASFFTGDVESGFVAAMLAYPVLWPLMSLQLIGEGVKKNQIPGE